mmetsp:Transcript_16523/g.21531  ORF Transcript_16523/g.21531 Transcript_16523/m.21531 type:complete len:111 (-) Transcript_16523:241-573(-)
MSNTEKDNDFERILARLDEARGVALLSAVICSETLSYLGDDHTVVIKALETAEKYLRNFAEMSELSIESKEKRPSLAACSNFRSAFANHLEHRRTQNAKLSQQRYNMHNY